MQYPDEYDKEFVWKKATKCEKLCSRFGDKPKMYGSVYKILFLLWKLKVWKL